MPRRPTTSTSRSADDVRTQVGKPGAYTFEPVETELAEETREELETLYREAYAAYARLVEKGVARELARSVIPVGAYTQFYWTVNARALMNFVSLRNAEFAQLEIRRYAEAVEAFFARRCPSPMRLSWQMTGRYRALIRPRRARPNSLVTDCH